MIHPNEGTITKLGIKKVFISLGLMYNPMNGAILAKAFSFLQAFLDTSEISSSKF